jgi:hypothetical protein
MRSLPVVFALLAAPCGARAEEPSNAAAAQAGLDLLLQTVRSDQLDDGSWSAWPDTRPPIFGNSHESMTGLAALALLPAAAAGDAASLTARDKALEWLSATATDDDPQSIALRLVLWRRTGRPAEESQRLIDRIRERQAADGGWSQAADMTSDAWATGQALYALAHADVGADDPAMARGQEFLVSTQREDGSWPMTSRPTTPGSASSTNLVPITGAGSAWAVIGLARGR